MSDTPRDRGGPWATVGRRGASLSRLAPLVAITLTGITLIAVVGMWASARLTVRSVETDLADTQQESLSLAVALDDYDRISQLSDWVTTVQSDLDTATSDRVRWTTVLDGVAATMPDGVGLIRFDGRADTREVSVTVESMTYSTLGDWLARTSATAGITDLSLISATRRQAASSQAEVVEAIARGHLTSGSGSSLATADSRERSR